MMQCPLRGHSRRPDAQQGISACPLVSDCARIDALGVNCRDGGQEQTSHTDNVGRLRETTLRRSPLRYASDWRQDIDTAPAALRMTSSTTSGFDNMGTCEEATSVVVAFHALRDKTLQIGGNRLVLGGEDIPA